MTSGRDDGARVGQPLFERARANAGWTRNRCEMMRCVMIQIDEMGGGRDHRTSHVRAKTRVSRICLAGSMKSASTTAADCAASIGVRMTC